jgi:hypothetical protein
MGPVRRAATLLVLLLFAGCTVRLIADHDEVLVQKTVALQERAEDLFLLLEEAAATPDEMDGAYGTHAAAYRELFVLLRVMAVRAAAMPKNELTQQQIAMLQDSCTKLRDQHRQNSERRPARELAFDLVQALRGPFEQHVTSILTLQHALRRGG